MSRPLGHHSHSTLLHQMQRARTENREQVEVWVRFFWCALRGNSGVVGRLHSKAHYRVTPAGTSTCCAILRRPSLEIGHPHIENLYTYQ